MSTQNLPQKKPFQLLTLGSSNPKTAKSEKQQHFTFILHLAPAKRSGYNMCPWSTPECEALCLNTAGHGGIFKPGEETNAVQDARIRRTRLFRTDRETFLALLVRDIEKGIRYALRKRLTPVFRLNGTSDQVWEKIPVKRAGVRYPHIFAAFPTEQFYDYTKAPYTLRRHDIPNYHLTFSLAETLKNRRDAGIWQAHGKNIAAVFGVKSPAEFPSSYRNRRVVNGDETDLRFLDPAGVVVGLKAKGAARRAENGFVITL